MKNKLISIGHKNPDTDSVLSAILISRFSKKLADADQNAKACIAGRANNETRYVLNRFKIKMPKQVEEINGENVILVDTTEPGQMAKGITENNLFAIIDHHNLGGLKSNKPIFARIEPVGSTATVIYGILKENRVKIDKISSALMLASIISDTLNLASPTTSSRDKKAMKELNKIAKLDLKKFAEDLFAAKSSLEGISVEEVVDKDYKNFDMGKNKVGIGVWETTNPQSINAQKEKIMAALKEKKGEENLNYIFFNIVDILRNNSHLYILGAEENDLARKIFDGEIKDNVMFLKGVVSRKKQLVPPLMDELGGDNKEQ